MKTEHICITCNNIYLWEYLDNYKHSKECPSCRLKRYRDREKTYYQNKKKYDK